MRKKSKVIITLCLCLCMVSILIPCFSLPVSAASYDYGDLTEWYEGAPTYFPSDNTHFFMCDMIYPDGDFYRVFFFNITSDSDTDTITLTANSNGSVRVGVSTTGTFYPFTYMWDNDGGTGLTIFNSNVPTVTNGGRMPGPSNVEGITDFHYYSTIPVVVDESIADSVTEYPSLYYQYPGAVYGDNGYRMYWNQARYHTVITQGNPNGGDEPPTMYLSYNYYNGDGYIGLRKSSQYPSSSVLEYGYFTSGTIDAISARMLYFWTSDSGSWEFQSSSYNEWAINKYMNYNSSLQVLYSNVPVRYTDESGTTTTTEATKPVNTDTDRVVGEIQEAVKVTEQSFSELESTIESSTDKIIQNDNENTDKIVGAVGDAAGQVTDKLDDIYNGEFPHELPTYDNDVDTESSDDLSEVSSSLLDSAKVDTSIFDAIRNLNWDGVPLVGRFMTLVIDLGFADVVVYCLSMGLGLAILGKRFG